MMWHFHRKMSLNILQRYFLTNLDEKLAYLVICEVMSRTLRPYPKM